MTQEQRRLAAVMFTDMVGYTLLAQNDERKAMTMLDEQRKIVRSHLRQHGGREVKTIGDAFLIEFASSLEAVNCAAAIQESIRSTNAGRRAEDQIVLRVGVHLGEVLESNGDIYGDAVNVASRIEPLAPPGGVCLSKQVYENVANKSNLRFESLGQRELKNVPTPLEVYRLVMSPEGHRITSKGSHLPADRVAVLPFVSMSPDPNDEYFADGLTEELISKLSQVKGLKVIARTSVMNYKKRQMNASEIGVALGAGTLVEGSVRKSGDKIRVTVQVVDSNTEEHRWSTSYDRNLADIFAVQTDIASRVTESLHGSLVFAPGAPQARDTNNVEAYTAFLRARELVRQPTESNLRGALELFEQAVKLDPSFARGYVGLADCHSRLGMHGFVLSKEARTKAREALARALEINPNLAEGHAEKALFAWFDDDFVTARVEAERAIELNPNLADTYENLALLVSSMGSLAESVKLLEKARELNPLSQFGPFLAEFYFYMGREQEALQLWAKTEQSEPIHTYTSMLEYEVAKGRPEKARDLQAKLEKMVPDQVSVVGCGGMIAAMEGDTAKARQVIEKMQQSYEGVGIMPNYVAYIYYLLGDPDEAFRWLHKAVETHSLVPHTIRFSPLFASLRADPRYRELLISNGLSPDNKE